MGLNMDQNNEGRSPMQHEYCYFDRMHARCQNWKTLTLWVYHPGSRKLMRLATMEVKKEDTSNCSLFWKLWNEMLAEIKGEPGYTFNPYGFITDEAGAIIN